jgi:primosomal protein N' (replication factor Y)
VATAIAPLPVDPTDVLGPVDLDGGLVRTIVRFDYSAGSEVAGVLRSELVRAATRRRTPAVPGRRAPSKPNLKLRFDDVEPFLED